MMPVAGRAPTSAAVRHANSIVRDLPHSLEQGVQACCGSADESIMCATMRAAGGRASAQGSSLIELMLLFSLVGTVSAFSLKNGYPDASTGGIRAVLVDPSGFATKATPNSVTFMKKGAPVAEQCAVTYTLGEPQLTAEFATKMVIKGC